MHIHKHADSLYLEELVFLAQLYSLGPAVVHSEEVGSDTTELEQLMLLNLLSEGDHVKVFKAINGLSQGLVVFFIDENLQWRGENKNNEFLLKAVTTVYNIFLHTCTILM